MLFSTLPARIAARLGSGLAARTLPSLCAVCRAWAPQRICADCLRRWAAAQPRCQRCAIEVQSGLTLCGACLLHPPPFVRAVAALPYAFPWDNLITRFKFSAALDLAPAFVRQLQAAVEDGGGNLPALLLPVPLSGMRLRERGFNQAWEITRRLGATWRCEADPHLLLRVRETPHQTALPHSERIANVARAFAVEPLRVPELRGREVAVVDDVMTTGATVAEMTRTLLEAGASRVQVWVLARTPRPDR